MKGGQLDPFPMKPDSSKKPVCAAVMTRQKDFMLTPIVNFLAQETHFQANVIGALTAPLTWATSHTVSLW